MQVWLAVLGTDYEGETVWHVFADQGDAWDWLNQPTHDEYDLFLDGERRERRNWCGPSWPGDVGYSSMYCAVYPMDVN